MSNSIRDKIVLLAAKGLPTSIIADAVGVTDSYVSQQLGEEGVAADILAAKGAALESAAKADNKMEKLELMALDKVEKLMPLVKNAKEATEIFSKLNVARRKLMETSGNSAGAQQVTLVLPKAARVMIQVNTENQVIEVEGKSIAPLPSRALPALASKVLEKPQHIQDVEARARLMDKKTAGNILQDLTTTINGVEVVI